jgi:hypothetical protein
MKYKVAAKSLSVYDPKTESFIAEFVNGEFETEDEKIIEALKRLGYEPEAEKKVEIVEPPKEEKKRGRPPKEKQ